MEIIEGMEIIDFYISDEAIYVLERLTELQDNHQYGTLRNIIYNARDREESSRRILSEQDAIDNNRKIEIRVLADENIRSILRFLGGAIGLVKIKEYDIMVSMIYGEWVDEEEKKRFGISEGLKKLNFASFGDVSRLTLVIRTDLWSKVKDIGSRRGLDKDECLKMAVVRFLERRYDLVRELLM